MCLVCSGGGVTHCIYMYPLIPPSKLRVTLIKQHNANRGRRCFHYVLPSVFCTRLSLVAVVWWRGEGDTLRTRLILRRSELTLFLPPPPPSPPLKAAWVRLHYKLTLASAQLRFSNLSPCYITSVTHGKQTLLLQSIYRVTWHQSWRNDQSRLPYELQLFRNFPFSRLLECFWRDVYWSCEEKWSCGSSISTKRTLSVESSSVEVFSSGGQELARCTEQDELLLAC